MKQDHDVNSNGFAPAKINLTLHVGASINDGPYRGYHPVDSLVVFADIGDQVTYDADAGSVGEITLDISGPFSKGLMADDDNLVLKAARAFFTANELTPRGQFHLIKSLPLASGIGGGSADAAAALRLLAAWFNVDKFAAGSLAARIGADVPVCYASKTAHMQGIGETVDVKNGLGAVPALLVNPGFAVSTAEIFKTFDGQPSDTLPQGQNWRGSLYDIAMAGGNDLQAIALSLQPEIDDVIKLISAQQGCRLARMSGSGATCFGLFETYKQAQIAMDRVKSYHPHYWCHAVMLGKAP